MKLLSTAAAVLLAVTAAQALPVTYTVDPGASSLTVSGQLAGTDHTEQAPGSLTASYSGSVTADLDTGMLTFFGGTSLVAASHPLNTFAPAAVFRTNDVYGVLVGPGIAIALCDIVIDLATGTVTNGAVPSGMTVFLTGGAIDVDGGGGGVVGGGLAAMNTTASAASLTTVGTIETLTLPIEMINQLDTDFTLVLSGTIVARRNTCGNGMLDPNEVCDDGNQSDGDCCAADCFSADPFCGRHLDNYKCYGATLRAGTFIGSTATLTDPFGTSTASIRQPTALCNPVDQSGSGFVDPTAHLTCYPVKDTPRRNIRPRNVLIRNQFGLKTLQVSRPSRLCVPSEKNGVASALDLDHYRCYKARVPVGSSGPDPTDVTLADQFETRAAQTQSFIEFCYPVSKNGAVLKDPNAYLTCYKLDDTSGLAPFTPFNVGVDNELGTQTLRIRPLPRLCVPTLKIGT